LGSHVCPFVRVFISETNEYVSLLKFCVGDLYKKIIKPI